MADKHPKTDVTGRPLPEVHEELTGGEMRATVVKETPASADPNVHTEPPHHLPVTPPSDASGAAAVAETPPGVRRRCPHCQGPLTAHGDANPHKVGALHCNQCGTCWNTDLESVRDGHPAPSK